MTCNKDSYNLFASTNVTLNSTKKMISLMSIMCQDICNIISNSHVYTYIYVYTQACVVHT